MDKVLLDTDILSEVVKGKDRMVMARARSYKSYFGYFTITTVAVLEVVKGWQRRRQPGRIQEFRAAIAREEILTLDVASAELAGMIYGDLERTGQPIGRADPMVAAIALKNNLTDHRQLRSFSANPGPWLPAAA